ncbi:MAG: hypothetical protein L6V81_05425 [Clostridium sp.]|nr:MAG: hypothetical protein L6V81_05425 [Clostridium sp.]
MVVKKDIIFNLICDGRSCNEICNLLGIGIEGYINFLKFMYYEVFLYGQYNEKIYLSVIRSALIEGYKVLRENTYVKAKSGEINIVPSIMRLRGLNEEVVVTNSPVSSLKRLLIVMIHLDLLLYQIYMLVVDMKILIMLMRYIMKQ